MKIKKLKLSRRMMETRIQFLESENKRLIDELEEWKKSSKILQERNEKMIERPFVYDG